MSYEGLGGTSSRELVDVQEQVMASHHLDRSPLGAVWVYSTRPLDGCEMMSAILGFCFDEPAGLRLPFEGAILLVRIHQGHKQDNIATVGSVIPKSPLYLLRVRRCLFCFRIATDTFL